MQPLGGLVSTHPVANSRRWVAGLGSLLIVAAAAGLLVFLIANPWGSRNFGAALAFALIPIAVVLPIACVQLVKAVRGIGESFEVYERGHAHGVDSRVPDRVHCLRGHGHRIHHQPGERPLGLLAAPHRGQMRWKSTLCSWPERSVATYSSPNRSTPNVLTPAGNVPILALVWVPSRFLRIAHAVAEQ